MTDSPGFRVEVTSRGSCFRARLIGSLDAATVPMLLEAVEPPASVARSVTLDCDALDFCDSSGLRGLVMIRNTMDTPDSLTIERATDALRQILAITGLTSLLADDPGGSDRRAPPSPSGGI